MRKSVKLGPHAPKIFLADTVALSPEDEFQHKFIAKDLE